MSENLGARFARAAAEHAPRVAIVAAGQEVTYEDLLDRAERTARRLDGELPREARVGLFATRDVDTYVSYLAVAGSGRTVVPLNPAFPAGRTTQMLDQAGVAGIIGPPPLLTALDGDLVALEAAAGRLKVRSRRRTSDVDGADDVGVTAGQPAYILFTSGTTGAPKGIPVTSRSVGAFLDHVTGLRPIEPGDRVSQCFDLTFDPSVADMFCAWSAGATLVVPSAGQLRDPVSFVNEFGVAHWSSVPSVISLARRMRQLRAGCLPRLRTSLFAGEPLTLNQARDWRAAAPASTVWNAYGPTEATIFCTAYRLPDSPGSWPVTSNGTVPIGEPFPAVRWRIGAGAADSPEAGGVAGAPGPAGERGELWLGGVQRFDGYLDPTHDRLAFATHRDEPEPYYRSGDNVVRTADGLVHLGRLDQQVQVHGYRVELSEVEGTLRGHPGVDEAVAAFVDGELTAVWTGVEQEPGPILDHVARRLPPYMVPGRLTYRTALPRNGNGKVDRGAIGPGPKPSTSAPAQACIDRLPQVPTKTYDCIQVNLALLFDATHPGADRGAMVRLGAELGLRSRRLANGLLTVDAEPGEEIARCCGLLGLVPEPLPTSRQAVQRRSAADHDSVTYVVGDAHDLPWLPYFGHAHMPHSFLVTAGPEGAAQVIDAYDNQTEWGPYEPGHVVVPWSALPVSLKAWAVGPGPEREPDRSADLEGMEGFIERYRTHPDRVEAWNQLAVESWLLARRFTLFAAARPELVDLGDHWQGLAADVFLAMRRVRRGRAEPVAVLDDLHKALDRATELHPVAASVGSPAREGE